MKRLSTSIPGEPKGIPGTERPIAFEFDSERN